MSLKISILVGLELALPLGRFVKKASPLERWDVSVGASAYCWRDDYLVLGRWPVTGAIQVWRWGASCDFNRFTFVIAFLLLLTGAALNDQHGEESMYFGNYNCYVVKPGVFAGGAVLSLASVTLGILYYLTLHSAKSNSSLWGNSSGGSGIAMGQPQFPPHSTHSHAQEPVFVHEDTYVRRQFT